jgi:hypothetical protein
MLAIISCSSTVPFCYTIDKALNLNELKLNLEEMTHLRDFIAGPTYWELH